MILHHNTYRFFPATLILCTLFYLEQTYLINHNYNTGLWGNTRVFVASIESTGSEQHDSKHARELQELGYTVQRRLHYIQNPISCETRRKLQCNVHQCRLGCKVNTVAMCLMIAYAINRTVVLSAPLTPMLLPISQTCNYSNEANRSIFDKDYDKYQVVERYFTNVYRPEFFPPSIPDDLLDKIARYHANPFLWWAAQFSSFVFNLTQETNEMLAKQEKKLGFERPVVGVHIRRTDKLIKEAKFHGVDDYMQHVADWFDTLEEGQPRVQRRIFLATDDPSVTKEIQERYHNYTLLHNANFTWMANSLDQRRSEEGLFGIIHDIHLLSKCDFLVCTFTSNVCRLAIQLMTSSRGNVTNYGVSLDRGKWNFVGSAKHAADAVPYPMPHYDIN